MYLSYAIYNIRKNSISFQLYLPRYAFLDGAVVENNYYCKMKLLVLTDQNNKIRRTKIDRALEESLS